MINTPSGVSETVSTETMPSNTNSKNNKKKSLLIFSVAVLILLVGGVLFAFTDIFKLSSEKTLMLSFKRFSEQKTFTSSINLKASVPLDEEITGMLGGASTAQMQTVTVYGTQKNDISNPDLVKFDTELNLETNALPIKLTLALRGIGDDLYMQVPDIGIFLMFIAPDLSVGDWLHISKSEIEDFVEKNSEAGSKDLFMPLTEQQKSQLQDYIVNQKMVYVIQEFPKEKINGTTYFHYGLGFDIKKIPELIAEINRVYGKEVLTEQELKDLFETTQLIDITSLDIWISRKTLLPYKLSGVITVPVDDEKTQVATVEFSGTYENFNMPVTINAPETTKELSALLNSLNEE